MRKINLKDKKRDWHWEKGNDGYWIGKDRPYYFETDVKEAILKFWRYVNSHGSEYEKQRFKQIFGDFEK